MNRYITNPEPLSMKLGGIGQDTDLLEGYLASIGDSGVTLIASTEEGEAVMRLGGRDVERLWEWLGEAMRWHGDTTADAWAPQAPEAVEGIDIPMFSEDDYREIQGWKSSE